MTKTSTHLNGHHRKTLATLFHHPASHNLEWHDVLSLLNHLGTVGERQGTGYDIAIGADRIQLGHSHGKDLAGDDIRLLRAFLAKAGLTPDGHAAETQVEEDPPERHCIVLIDHQQARLFGLGGADADPTEPLVLKPDDADGSHRRIEHKQMNDDHDGGHAAEEDGYYERVSADLKSAQRIVVFSDGKGRSNAGAYLIDYLKRHQPAIADRIVAERRVDIAHLTDREIVSAGTALLDAG